MSQSTETSNLKTEQKEEEIEEEVKTLFVSGLPLNVREREIYLLFQQCPGYDSSIIKLKGKSAVAFVLFEDNKTASNAIEKINVKKTFSIYKKNRVYNLIQIQQIK